MSVQVDVNYNGVALTGAFVNIVRIFGNKQGWNSLVEVYAYKGIYDNWIAGLQEDSKPFLKELNIHAPYVQGQDPYVSVTNAIINYTSFSNAVEV
jgi:hypothetical protein